MQKYNQRLQHEVAFTLEKKKKKQNSGCVNFPRAQTENEWKNVTSFFKVELKLLSEGEANEALLTPPPADVRGGCIQISGNHTASTTPKLDLMYKKYGFGPELECAKQH